MAEHTPWDVDGLAIRSGNDTVCIMGEINGFESGYTACKNWQANAALIVRAVNSHDALVKALETLLAEAENFSVSGVYFSEECMGHKGPTLARAALALSEQDQ